MYEMACDQIPKIATEKFVNNSWVKNSEPLHIMYMIFAQV